MKIGALLQSLNHKKTGNIQSQTEKNKSEILLDEYKAKETTLPKEVQSIFDKYQISPSSDTVKQVDAFMKNAKGTEAEKLQTLEVALYKGIEPTEDKLLSIHEALTHDVANVKALVESPKVNAIKLPNKDLERAIAALKLPETIKNEIAQIVDKGVPLKEALLIVVESLGLDPPKTDDLTKLIRALQNVPLSATLAEEPVLMPKRSQPVVQVSVPLSEKPFEPVEKAAYHEAESNIQMDSEVVSTDQKQSQDQDDDMTKLIEDAIDRVMEHSNEVYQMLSETLNVKTFMIEVTTEATIKAKQTFEAFKKETVALLENVQKPENKADISSDLTKAVEKVNHIILKSDVTLFTDMPTEKKLLVMSSELDHALVLIKNGELVKAQKIVTSATDLLKSIKFSPSQRRVQVFAEGKLERLESTFGNGKKSVERIDIQIKNHLETHRDSKLARDVVETLRFLGLNHEMEVAESIEKNPFETYKEWNQSNIKEILLRLMKEEIENKTVSATEQNLMNLSGQQMMNDSGSEEQPFYFFNMPILEDEELGNMKIFMRGASKNHQIDWQNSELYFGISIKGAAPVGIKVKVKQRQLDIELLT
ncbi:MAG TPA: hypothetical protein DCS67_06045, partial [Clostridiales bacterium UBA8960]|nr:hypothetical protein [Clostridiales bacterium UBA8960]